jgi:hypothetical protein
MDVKSDGKLTMSSAGDASIKAPTVKMDDVIRMASGLAQDAASAPDADSTDLGKAPKKKSVKKEQRPTQNPDAHVTTDQAAGVYSQNV